MHKRGVLYFFLYFCQLHTVSRLHGKLNDLSVKSLRFRYCSLSANFWRHCVFRGGTYRRALRRHQSEEIKISNIKCPRVGIEPTTCRVYSHTLVPLRKD